MPKLFAVFLPYQVLVLCDIGLVAFGMIQDSDANAVNIGKIYTSVRYKEHRFYFHYNLKISARGRVTKFHDFFRFVIRLVLKRHLVFKTVIK